MRFLVDNKHQLVFIIHKEPHLIAMVMLLLGNIILTVLKNLHMQPVNQIQVLEQTGFLEAQVLGVIVQFIIHG